MGALVVGTVIAIGLYQISLIQCITRGHEQFRIDKIQLECYNKEKPDALDILMLRLGHWTAGEDNISLQKWVLCILVRYGLMSKHGVFKQDRALALVPKAKHNAVLNNIDHCLYKTKHLPHETAWKYLKCTNRGNPMGLRLV